MSNVVIIYDFKFIRCDTLWENQAYGGTKRTDYEQTWHFCVVSDQSFDFLSLARCDTLWENLAYGGTKRTDSEQTWHFCVVSDQSFDFLSLASICRKHFLRSLHNLNIIYEYKYMKRADLGKHCSLLHKPSFPQITSHLANYFHITVYCTLCTGLSFNPLNAG